MADVGQRVVMDLRNALYRHILGQSAGFFAQRTTGQLMSRINNDVGQVQQVVSETVGDLARESLAVVGYAALLFYLDARLTIVCLTGAPMIVYPLIRLGQRVRRTTRRSQEALENLSHISAEAFTGHRIVKAFGTEAHETDKFSRAGYSLFRTNMKVTAALSSLPPLMEVIGGFGMAAALVVRSQQVASGSMTTGAFFSFMAAVFLMYGPAKKLSRVNANLQQATAAAERIFEMLDTHTEVQEKPGAADRAVPARHRVPRRRFRLRRGPGRILRGVSFQGAGRADGGDRRPERRRQDDARQPAAAILRRHARRILIDGVDIRQVTLASLRQQIGIVTQETVLFDDTVARNIAYGVRGGDEGARSRRRRGPRTRTNSSRALPRGYETIIGERGQRLSAASASGWRSPARC